MDNARFDALIARLNEVGADGDCVVCDHNAWRRGHETLLQTSPEDSGMVLGRGYQMLTLICGNCGNVRTHHVATLDGTATTSSAEGEERTGDDEDSEKKAR
jgi:hypothetical protein